MKIKKKPVELLNVVFFFAKQASERERDFLSQANAQKLIEPVTKKKCIYTKKNNINLLPYAHNMHFTFLPTCQVDFFDSISLSAIFMLNFAMKMIHHRRA